MSNPQPVYYVKGDDAALTSQALSALLNELLGGRSADVALQEITEDQDMSDILDALQTPAFLTDRRIVLVRDSGRFRADAVDPLIAYLAAPMPSSVLVLTAGGGAIPTRLSKAIKAHGHVVDAGLPSGKGRQTWFAAEVKKGPVRLDPAASNMLFDHLADELGQLTGVLDALAAAYGENAKVTADQLRPFLGTGGAAAPWELTDAIDAGDTVTALRQLRRMLEAGQRHPLVIMATLQRHVTNLMRLDGADVQSDAQAASLLGVAPFPAKKAMAQARKLGSANIARAVRLTSEADVDLRGGSAWPNELVLEVLVARLARMAPSRSAASRSRRAG